MTDNEIIKALELCATLDANNCKKCPCQKICNECDGTLTKMVLDLINRKMAENEENSLKIEHQANIIKILENALENKRSEIERLNSLLEIEKFYATLTNEGRKTSKIVAIKEYKKKVKAILMEKGIYPVVVKNALDEAEKEMVGESNV